MDYKKFLKIEIFFKILSKIAGIGKSLLLLLIFGFSTQLDSHYLAFSLIGIILSISVVFELLYMGELKSNIELNNLNIVQKLFFQLIIISGICSIVIAGIVLFFYNIEVVQHVLVLLLWSVCFIINSFNILILRIKHEYKVIGLYFLLFPLITTALIIFGYYGLKIESSINVSISILFSEVILIFFFNRKIKFKYFSLSKSNVFKLNFLSRERTVHILQSFSLILAVYLIDITDKSFSYELDAGYTTVLIYGGLLPLMIRQALDFKSVFYHKLQDSPTIKTDLQNFYQTLKWFFYLILPIMIILIIASRYVKLEHVNFFLDVKQEHFKDLINVFSIYVFILPMYIIWDMVYRIYFKNKFLNKLFIIMFIGVVLNYILNYIFVKWFFMKASGIALSTLIILSIYCLYSFVLLKTQERKNLKLS